MLPIGPLMIEHRLIERLMALMQQELSRIRENVAVDPEFSFVDPVFIDTAVDFLKTYADRCHHGKEEGILFAELAKKSLSPEHRRTMEDLIREHAWARETTAKLSKAKENYLLEKAGALAEVLESLGKLVEFYPRHIEKEDQHFFLPVMDYLMEPEKSEMLRQMADFDQKLIHEKYQQTVAQIEGRRACRI